MSQHPLKVCHLLFCGLGDMRKGELNTHIIVFDLAYLTEGQQLYFIHVDVAFCDATQL